MHINNTCVYRLYISKLYEVSRLDYLRKVSWLDHLQQVIYLLFFHYLIFTCEARKSFSFHFKSSFRFWDNQILTFQIFKYHDAIKCPNMKHKTHIINNLRSKHSLGMKFGQFMLYYEMKFIKKITKNMAWKLVPGLF